MGGEQDRFVRKLAKGLPESPMLGSGERLGHRRIDEVGPGGASDDQRAATEKDGRTLTVEGVGKVLGRMPGRCDRFDGNFADFYELSRLETAMGECRRRVGWNEDRRPRGCSRLEASGDEVSMQVGLEKPHDMQIQLIGRAKVPIN